MSKRNLNLNQLSLPFSDRGGEVLSYENRSKAFWTLAMLSLLAIVAYIYALNMTAHNVAQRSALENELAQLSTELATLEFEYIELKDQVTMETARALGFSEASRPLYIAKDKEEGLSFNR